MTQAQLHRDPAIAKSTISEVPAGKKPFSCEHHFGGMFRRPFLYAPSAK